MTRTSNPSRWLALGMLGLLLGSYTAAQREAGSQGPPEVSASADAPAEPDLLASLGYAVTGGAAPGYVEDRACALCHREIARSFREVGMGRSFFRPRPALYIENFDDNHFFHQKSGRHYQMVRSGDRLLFRRYQVADSGRVTHLFEEEVDWVLGSGHHARTYLYQTEAGELYQLPIAWYTQTESWGMAPGFDRPDHQGVRRQVRRECMFCHNGYPDVAEGTDGHDDPHLFPANLPEGIGCQRCHGPGAEHTRIAIRGARRVEEIQNSIVNPARLEPGLQRDLCYQCHMQPSVAIPGVRRFGRGDYSYRPGEPLPDYLVQIDVVEEGKDRSERFEINHHPYRLEQSRCFQESAGALSCLTCHDPHRKVPASSRTAHYRAACLTCHQLDDCDLQAMTAHGEVPQALAAVDPQDCVTCHMPRRRTQDVVQVVMTDHRIQRQPGGPELLSPLEEHDPVLVGVEFLEPERAPSGALGEIYRAVAVLRMARSAPALDWLEKNLARARPPELQPYLDLASGQLLLHRFEAAEKTLRDILQRHPDHAQARQWLGIALAGLGRREEALETLAKAVELPPELPEIRFNLGRLLLGHGRPQEALPHLRRALEFRPNMAEAWFHLGNAHRALDHPNEAAAHYRRALEIEPSHREAAQALEESRLRALPESPGTSDPPFRHP